jgi:UDP-GlcNAc:undecaprenyl-phosphate GlcNAc-1-phosphate transferase
MVLVGGTALLTALVTTPAAAWLAKRLGVLDRPGPLKVHQRPVPYLGGLAVFAAGAIGAAAGRPALAIPGVLAVALGTADDAATLPAWLRLACEGGIGAAAAIIVPLRSGPIGGLGTAALVVVVINALNMMDGLDGLASGVAMTSAAGLAFLVHGDSRVLAVALACGLAGFLWYNRPPARIYLGDGGAYLVGTWLALLAASSWRSPTPGRDGASALLLLAVPLIELVAAVLRRARRGQHLFSGDRDHVYDQLVARGWTPTRTALAFVGVQTALVIAGLGASRTSSLVATVVSAVTLACLLLAAGAAGFLAPTPMRRAH